MKKKLLAWMLAVSMALSPISVWGAEEQASIFLDEPETEIASEDAAATDAKSPTDPVEGAIEAPESMTDGETEAPEFSDGAGSETVFDENADTAANGFEDPVIIELGKETIVDIQSGESVFFVFTPKENGTYHFVQTLDTGETADFTQKGIAGEPHRIFSIEGGIASKQLTLFVEKVPDIKSIRPEVSPDKLIGYTRIGGESLDHFLRLLNPKIRVEFENQSETTVAYCEELESYGCFRVHAPQGINGDLNNLKEGTHDFVFNIAGYTSDVFTYQLEDITSADSVWPQITENTEAPVVLTKNYASCYAFRLTAGASDTSYHITYSEEIPELSTRFYDQAGNRETWGGNNIWYTVPKNEVRYVVAVPISQGEYPNKLSVSLESQTIHEYNSVGSYDVPLTKGSAQYYFTAPESKTYRFSSKSERVHQVIANTEIWGNSFAYEMKKDEKYRIIVTDTSESPNPTAVITIEEAPTLLSMEVNDSVKRQRLLEDGWWYAEYNALNTPIKLNFDDGSSLEETYGSYEIRVGDYGHICHRLRDEDGNIVYRDDIKAETYYSEFYIRENEKIRAKGPDIEYIPIEKLELPELNVNIESKISKSSVGNGIFLAKLPVRDTDQTYKLSHQMNAVRLQDKIGKVNPENGKVEAVAFSDDRVTIPAKEVYYLSSHCLDFACPDEIRYLLQDTADLVSITCVSGKDDSEYVREFWDPHESAKKYDFEIKTSDGRTETLNLAHHSYSEILDEHLGVIKTDDESGEFSVGFSEFPDQTVTLKCNLVSLADVEEGKCETKLTDITEYLGAKEYQDVWTNLDTNKGYFKFTALKAGKYKFSQKYSSVTKICDKMGSYYPEYEGDYILTLKEGQTIYGCGEVSGNTMRMKVTETKDSQKPEVASIELKKGSLSCEQFLSGLLYENSTMNRPFKGETLNVTYKNGEREEIVVHAFEPQGQSGYYRGSAQITWPETVYGEGYVEFVLQDNGGTIAGKSKPYPLQVLNEMTESIPTIKTEGRHKIENNLGQFGNRQVLVFKAPESGKYSFVIDKNVNSWMGFDDVCIYPRNYRTMVPGEETGYMDYFSIVQQKGWTYNLKAGEEICIGISMEMKPKWIDIQKHNGAEMSVEGLGSPIVDEFEHEAYENTMIHLKFNDGTQETFRYEDEKSSYLGSAWYDEYSTEAAITYFMEGDRSVSVSYPVERVSVKDVFESGQIPEITKTETEYTVPAKYNHLNIYAITMEEAGFYQITVKHNGKDITKNIEHMVHKESYEAGVYSTYDSQYPISFKAGETLYVANEYLDDEISVSVEKVRGIKSFERDMSNGSGDVSATYAVELLEQLAPDVNNTYFGHCWFNVTFDDGKTERVKFGNKVHGYGRIGISWPTSEYDMDYIQTGDNLTANFYIEGADSVYAPLEGLTIKKAAHLGISSSETDNPISLSEAEEAGLASCFQYEAEEDAIYTIKFSDTVSEAKSASEKESTETIKEQVKIVVSDERKTVAVYDFPSVPGGEINVPLKQNQTMFVSYYGACDTARIVEDTTEIQELKVTPGNVRFLAGDTSYNFDGWTFGFNGQSYTVNDITKYGSILPQWDFSGDLTQTPGTYEVTFCLETRPEIKSAPVEITVVSAEESGLPSIEEGTAYSFGGKKAVFTAEDELYEYTIQWKDGEKHALSYMNSMGETNSLTKETDTLLLQEGTYIFSDDYNAVVSFVIRKIDKLNLNALCEKAAELKREDYNCTDEEWNTYVSVLNNANVILAGRYTQSEIDAAADALTKAIAGLEKKPVVTPSPTPTPRPPVIITPTPKPLPDHVPDGSKWEGDTIVTPNGTKLKPDGSIVLPDGTELVPDSTGKKPSIDKSGIVTDINGIEIHPDHSIVLPGEDEKDTADDTVVSRGEGTEGPLYDPKDETVTIKEGNVVTHPQEMVQKPAAGSTVDKEGTILMPDGTKITSDGVTHRTDGGKTSYKGEVLKPAIPIWEKVDAAGNTPVVLLKGLVYGAEGYDYVIGKDIDCIKTKDYLQIRKNQLVDSAKFSYLQKGTYYAYCHSWIRDENGKKLFGEWSKPQMFKVASTTPAKPQILKVKVNGRNVTVTYEKSKNATGYDLVLGTQVKKVNGEYRPAAYGKYVIKNVGKNVESVTFKNVKPGTYYVGMHAFNRTSKNKTKVFSPWSNRKTIKIGKALK